MNEELESFDPNERLRWAVHEIVTKLKLNEQLTFTELSKRLVQYKINIPVELIKTILTEWDSTHSPCYDIFKKEDNDWLDVFYYADYCKRKPIKDKQGFGKHRKKEEAKSNVWRWPANQGTTKYPYGMDYYGD
jgi:hypothetical protein